MRLFSHHEEVNGVEGEVAVVIGNFDGVHRGHQALIRRARSLVGADGVVMVLTFSPHPVQILAPDKAPPLIASPHDKRRLLKGAGVDGVLEQTFTKNFASLSPETFARLVLVQGLRARHVVVGYDFCFGARRAGTTADLIAFGEALGFTAHIVEAQTAGDEVASSSAIRAAVGSGEVEAAAEILGRPFHLDGTVMSGDRRGRTIGFPTANVEPVTALMPAGGVYAGWLDVRDRGGPWPAVINVGTKPTFGGTKTTVEAHAIDVAELDAYGQEAHVYFERRLRSEQRFDGIEALVAQISRDRDAARADLAQRQAPPSLLALDVPAPEPA